MSDKGKDLRKRKQQQKKLKAAPIFYKRTLPKVKEDIDLIGKKLDEELAENRKLIGENDKKILESVNYEQLLKLIQVG